MHDSHAQHPPRRLERGVSGAMHALPPGTAQANRTHPPFYEGGLGVKSRFGQSALTVLAIDAGGEQCSSFYRLLIGEDKADGRFAPAVQFIEGRQAAKGSVAPAGA